MLLPKWCNLSSRLQGNIGKQFWVCKTITLDQPTFLTEEANRRVPKVSWQPNVWESTTWCLTTPLHIWNLCRKSQFFHSSVSESAGEIAATLERLGKSWSFLSFSSATHIAKKAATHWCFNSWVCWPYESCCCHSERRSGGMSACSACTSGCSIMELYFLESVRDCSIFFEPVHGEIAVSCTK